MSELTIGIPCYNEGKYIEQCLVGLLHQDCKVVIADNGSTDNTLKVITSFLKNHLELNERTHIVLNDKNYGQYHTFKQVFDECDTPYFMWMGAHDCISPDFVAETLPLIKDCSMASGTVCRIEHTQQWHRNWESATFVDEAMPVFQGDALKRYTDSILKLTDCSIFHSIFRKADLDDFTFKDTPSGDHVIISHLLWKGEVRYSKGIYYRRYFDKDNREQKAKQGSYDKGVKLYNHYLEDFSGFELKYPEPFKSHIPTIILTALLSRWGVPECKVAT